MRCIGSVADTDLQQRLDSGDDRQIKGDHDKEDSPAQHCPQLPLPRAPSATVRLSTWVSSNI